MARSFANASSEYLRVSSAVVTATPLTLACWFNVNNATAEHQLIFIGDSTSNTDMFGLIASGVISGDPVRAHATNSAGAFAQSSTGYSASTWHHAAGVFTSSTDRAAFIDGGSKGTATDDLTPTGFDRTAIAVLDRLSPASYVDGEIAEAAIWDAALTDGEVASLAAGYSPLLIRPTSLKAYWPLGGITKNDADKDIVGGYDMTAFNTPTTAEHPSGLIYPSGAI